MPPRRRSPRRVGREASSWSGAALWERRRGIGGAAPSGNGRRRLQGMSAAALRCPRCGPPSRSTCAGNGLHQEPRPTATRPRRPRCGPQFRSTCAGNGLHHEPHPTETRPWRPRHGQSPGRKWAESGFRARGRTELIQRPGSPGFGRL